MSKIKIGARLKELREAKGVSQQEVAKATGLLQKNISSYERDKSVPPIDVLYQIAKYYQVSLDFLVSQEINLNNNIINDKSLINYILYIERLDIKDREALKRIIRNMIFGNKDLLGVKNLLKKNVKLF